MHRLLAEIKRRRVLPVAALFAVATWLALQVADVLFPAWGIADRALRYLVYAAILCFPVALVFSWRYDITATGIVRTAAISGHDERTLTRVDIALLGLLATAVLAIGGWTVNHLARDDPPLPPGPANSVAVLPFELEPVTYDPLAEQLADEVLTALTRLHGLKVTGRESSFHFSAPVDSLSRVAKLLKVRHFLTGQVTSSGDPLTVHVQLIRMPGERAIWAQSFVAGIDEASTIPGAIAIQVAGAMRINVPDSERSALRPEQSASPEIHQLMRLNQQRMEADDAGKAIEFIDRAVSLDPDYAPAQLRRAQTYFLSYGSLAWPPLPRVEQVMDEALQKARAIGADNTFDYYQVRMYQARRAIRSLGATPALENILKESFEHLVAINPSDGQPYVSYSIYLRRKREFDRVGQLLEKALDFDPLHSGAIWQYSRFLSAVGRREEAIEYAKRLPEFFDMGYGAVASRYWEDQQFDQAIKWSIPAADQSLYQKWLLALSWASIGAPDRAMAMLQTVREGDDQTLAPIAASTLIALGGDYRSAYRQLAEMIGKGSHDRRLFDIAIDFALRAGDFGQAVELIETGSPALRDPVAPLVEEARANDALALACALRRLQGDEVRTGILFSQVLDTTRNRPRIGWDGIGIRDALVYACQGDSERALSALQDAYDAGWRELYDELGLLPVALNGLLGNSRFDALRAAIDQDLKVMRKHALELTGQ